MKLYKAGLEKILKVLDKLLQVEHVEMDEFLEIIADIQDAGWAVKVVRENEIISDQVLNEVFSDTYFTSVRI